MEPNHVAELCRALSVKDLLRATTVDAEDYEPAFHAAAQRELSRRGHEVATTKSRARLIYPDGTTLEVNVEDIDAMLPREFAEGAMVGIENCVDDVLVFQRHRTQWVAHHAAHNGHKGSWICPSDEAMHAAARGFARLEDWHCGLVGDVPLSDWVVIEPSCGTRYVQRAMEAMEAEGIDARAVPAPPRSLCRGACIEVPGYVLMVPVADEERSRAVLATFSEVVAGLHSQAALHAERAEAVEELAAYEEILALAPEDQVALFNRGVLLMETGRHEEALDCLVPLIGRVEDDTLADIHHHLQGISRRAPSIPVFHAMADIERVRGDVDAVRRHLEDALRMDANDAMTHLTLAYLFYEDAGSDTESASHFRRYLDLVPDADDREVIETILEGMDGR
jgi:tetratricopeptide (TPR) repeat protein